MTREQNMHTDPSHAAPAEAHEVPTVEAGDRLTISYLPKTCPAPFHISMEINASSILAKINQWPEEKRPSLSAFLIQGTGKTLETFPLLNATFISEDQLKFPPTVNIAVAAETPTGLKYPVLLDVNHQTILSLHHDLKKLKDAASRDALSPTETEGATFTIANLGMFGVAEYVPALKPPQVAILAVGAITYRLVMTGNRIINFPFFTLTLTCDPRVIDAAMAAKFLRRLKESLEE